MKKNQEPLVSILVPAYNEEKKIAHTIKSLKKLNYPNLEIVILNDGSRDRTADVVRKNIENARQFVFIDNKNNKGKAATLNQGIDIAKGKYIATIDADSIVEPDMIQKVLPYFNEGGVGAVTVSVAVKEPKTFLDKIIALEYALGLSLFLKLFSFIDCVFVTPGPFSIYPKRVLQKIGGFDPTNITEDLEIAYRLHKSGYKIKNCIEAKVSTILPETFKKIYIQRVRWYSGAIRTLFQHKDILFNRKYKLFGFFIPFNYTLIFLGLGLFMASTYLFMSKSIKNIVQYRYTNFNFLDHLTIDLNILNYGTINILGISIFIATVLMMVMGIKMARQKFTKNKLGMVGYPFLFFLYQIFWIGSVIAILKRKKVKWR